MSQNFDLDNYETVKQRKMKFYGEYPDGSLVSELVFHEKGHVIIKGQVFRNKEEQEKNVPTGVGYAEEFQGQGGFANKHAWMENCDESAIGRALDNAGFSGNGKCSREEIQKVQRAQKSKQRTMSLVAAVATSGWTPDQFKEFLLAKYDRTSKDLTEDELTEAMRTIKADPYSKVMAEMDLQKKPKIKAKTGGLFDEFNPSQKG